MDIAGLTIEIATIFKELRTKLGYSYEYVAKKLGVSPEEIELSESGEDFRFLLFWGLADVYKIKQDEIFKIAERRINKKAGK